MRPQIHHHWKFSKGFSEFWRKKSRRDTLRARIWVHECREPAWFPGPRGFAGARAIWRSVIEQGEKFLGEYPASPYRANVLLAVAQGWETWWSLSQSSEGAEGQTRPYAQGSRPTGDKAIAYYKELMNLAPESDYATYARRHLPRLVSGVDTGQRRFYSEFED